MTMSDDRLTSACITARDAIERCEREDGELPPDVRRALEYLNRYLFDRDLKKIKANTDEIAAWLGAAYNFPGRPT